MLYLVQRTPPKWLGLPYTVHGFRSSFRDWAAEETDHPGEVIEMCLAHAIRNKAEAAYRRGALIDKRRTVMEAWAESTQIAPHREQIIAPTGKAAKVGPTSENDPPSEICTILVEPPT